MNAKCAPDLAIRGGLLIDGTGGPPSVADVGVVGDRIVAIGAVPPATHEVNVSGHVVRPGLIESDCHDGSTLTDPGAQANRLAAGITTVVAGGCGRSVAPAWGAAHLADGRQPFGWPSHAGFFAHLDAEPPAVNVAVLVGHATLRVEAMGHAARAPWPSERRLITRWLAEGLDAGCLGMSSDLGADPGHHAAVEELTELVTMTTGCRGVWSTSLPAGPAAAAVNWVLAVNEAGDATVLLCHPIAPGRGRTAAMLSAIDEARAAGRQLVLVQAVTSGRRAAAFESIARHPAAVLAPGAVTPLAPEDAVHRMSGLPSEILRLRDRGVLRPGAYADIVVAEPDGTVEKVLVNGTLAWSDGAPTDARAGRPLRRDG